MRLAAGGALNTELCDCFKSPSGRNAKLQQQKDNKLRGSAELLADESHAPAKHITHLYFYTEQTTENAL